MKRRKWLAGAALAVLASAAVADADFAWQWPLRLAGDGEPVYRVVLGEEHYAALHDPLLRDILVIDAAGTRMPSALQSANRTLSRERRREAVAWFPLATAAVPDAEQLQARFAASGLEIDIRSTGAATPTPAQLLVDLGTESAGSAVALWLSPAVPADASWSARLQLEGSADLARWDPLGGPFELHRLRHDGRTLSQLRIPLQQAPRYLRLRYPDPAWAGAVAAIEVEREAAVIGPLPPLQWLRLRGRPGEGADEWLFELPGPMLVDAWRLRVEQRAWFGTARLASRAAETAQWQPRDEAVAYRIDLDGRQLDDGEHRVAGSRDRHWQVHWQGQGEPRLEFAFRADELLFVAEGQSPYRLVAGSRQQRRVDAPTAALLAAVRQQRGAHWQAPLAEPGTRSDLAGEAALRPADDPATRQRVLLWIVLIAVALSVVLMALRLLRAGPAPPSAP